MDIKYGSIEYFELECLQTNLKSSRLNKFNLPSLDKLRFEVDIKIAMCRSWKKIDKDDGKQFKVYP